MKRILLYIAIIATAICGVQAKKMSDLKIYINPGHGGYTGNDRPIQIYPFATNDTLGYWESKSNLYKGLHMYHILDSLGTKAYLSRTKNTEADDRSLSGIAAEANSLGVDLFFSIHSNAGESVNYPLMLYREEVKGTPRYPENVTLSKILWKNLHSNKLPVWTHNSEYVKGDLTFYDGIYKTGLGVLRPLYVVGLLSEGSMHEHRPEAHRLMNDDVWWLEAWHFVRTIMEFADTEDRFVTGNVAGVVYDNHNTRENVMPARFTMHGRDKNAPVNGAFVELIDGDGKQVQKRTTDDMYNGVFVFRNVTPGDYTVRVSHPDFYTETYPVTVVANEVTYNDAAMTLRREMPLEIVRYSPNVPEDELVSCASSIEFDFNTDVDVESFEKAFSVEPAIDGYFVYSESMHKVAYVPELSLARDTEYTVTVTTEARTPDKYYDHPNMVEPLVFKFRTRDRDAMALIDQFPQDGGKIHYASPAIEFRFDNTIALAGNYDVISIVDSKGKAQAVNKRTSKFNQLSNNYGNAVYMLTSNLTPGETYTATLSKELRDVEQLPLSDNVVINFTATDETQGHEGSVIDDFERAGAAFAYVPEETVGTGNVKPGCTRSTANKLFDQAGARFTYTFTANRDGSILWAYNGDYHQFEVGDAVGVYVQGDFNNHELYLGFTSGTDTKYAKLCDLDFLGWQYKEIKLDMLESGFTYLFSHVKLDQVSSPITQKGAFTLDNLSIVKNPNGVDDITAETSDKLISNVASQPGYVIVSASSDVAAFTLVDLTGKTVAQFDGTRRSLPVAGLAKGIYLLKASAASGRCHTVKVIVK